LAALGGHAIVDALVLTYRLAGVTMRTTWRLLCVFLLLGGCASDPALSEALGAAGHGPECPGQPHGNGPPDHAPAWGYRAQCDASVASDAGPPSECAAGETRDCTTDLPGRCAPGAQACVLGSWAACAPTAELTPEVCNGLDDECNGVVDDEVFDDGMIHPKCGVFPPTP
jgi:hypothetical protein